MKPVNNLRNHKRRRGLLRRRLKGGYPCVLLTMQSLFKQENSLAVSRKNINSELCDARAKSSTSPLKQEARYDLRVQAKTCW